MGVIKLDDVRAPINATSEFGDVFISRLNADAIVHTDSGGIELSRITQGQVALSTRSGRLPDRSTARGRLQHAVFRRSSDRRDRREA